MMTARMAGGSVEFESNGKLAGRYVYDDPFKPYIHPLNTPDGHTLTLCSPHDHKHHKALMYALRTSDTNFWEEVTSTEDEVTGRERHDGFETFVESGDEAGFDESLTWLHGNEAIFNERRSIHCKALSDQHAFQWSWETALEPLRDVELIMSQWSRKNASGELVNYHGLGARLRRDFGCTGGNQLLLDGVQTPFSDGLGATPNEVTFEGSIDGIWPVPKAGITIWQSQRNALFVTENPFAYISLGPSNLKPLSLNKGETIVERYAITVFDLV